MTNTLNLHPQYLLDRFTHIPNFVSAQLKCNSLSDSKAQTITFKSLAPVKKLNTTKCNLENQKSQPKIYIQINILDYIKKTIHTNFSIEQIYGERMMNEESHIQ